MAFPVFLELHTPLTSFSDSDMSCFSGVFPHSLFYLIFTSRVETSWLRPDSTWCEPQCRVCSGDLLIPPLILKLRWQSWKVTRFPETWSPAAVACVSPVHHTCPVRPWSPVRASVTGETLVGAKPSAAELPETAARLFEQRYFLRRQFFFFFFGKSSSLTK